MCILETKTAERAPVYSIGTPLVGYISGPVEDGLCRLYHEHGDACIVPSTREARR